MEITVLKQEHHAFVRFHGHKRFFPTAEQVRYSTSYIEILNAEEVRRERIKAAALKESKHFGNFPLPSDQDISGCCYLTEMYSKHQWYKPESLVLAVASCDGELYYSLSGEEDTTKGRKILPKLSRYTGDIFVKSFAVNSNFKKQQEEEREKKPYKTVRVCAEPKLWNDNDKSKLYTGMTIVWLGTAPNDYPLIPDLTGFGSPMLPCKTCFAWSSMHLSKDGGSFR
jgi:hypothetical protein